MKHIKKFESIYSAAAMIAPEKYSQPGDHNSDYIVDKVLITFPDTTSLIFDIVNENYRSDKINYKIKIPKGETREYKLYPETTLQSLYIKIFGDSIQMENYQEFVFVRCWNNPQDFIDNDWNGYIFKSNGDSKFNEIFMEFNIKNIDKSYQLTQTAEFFKNSYLSKNSIGIILLNFLKDLPQGIDYKKLMDTKRKFESYLLNIDETKKIDLIEEKIDGISIMSLIYAMQLKDIAILKNFNFGRDSNPRSCSVSKLLDILF